MLTTPRANNFSANNANKIEMFDQITIVTIGHLLASSGAQLNHSEGEIKTPYLIKFSKATRPLETT